MAGEPIVTYTPETVSKLIRHGLLQMSVDNAHHEFEHLCRHLARRRLCSNIIPATGPVAGGGDQGADFESIQLLSDFGTSRYWRLIQTGRIVFACSLEKNLKKKVKADLKSAANRPSPPDRLYFFYPEPIKVSVRNALKEIAKQQYKIELEILDGVAIAEFLADPEMLWIAERYLSLPGGISLPGSPTTPAWYKEILQSSQEDGLSFDVFFQLSNAARYARQIPELHSDIPALVVRLKHFKQSPTLEKRAFYEEFVAVLRGLNAAEGYETEVLNYLSDISTLTSASDLENSAVIIGYAQAASERGILHIPKATFSAAIDQLIERIDGLLTSEISFENCSLLYVKAFALLHRTASEDGLGVAIEAACPLWNELLDRSEHVALYPIERLPPLINMIFGASLSEPFTRVVQRLDAAMQKRVGDFNQAQQHLVRADNLIDAKEYLRALHELHRALPLSHSKKSQDDAILTCIQISRLYAQLGLLHASKYFGLAAAYASIELPEESLRDRIAIGLSLAVQADYASGASLLYMIGYRLFCRVGGHFSIAGSAEKKQEERAKLDYYALLLHRVSEVIDGGVHERLSKIIRECGIEEAATIYKEELDNIFRGLDYPGLQKRFHAENAASPFSDIGNSRLTSWRQLGVDWNVDWISTQDAEKGGEAFVAMMQIVLASLSDTEFSLLATNVNISLRVVNESEASPRQVDDNDDVAIHVAINPHRPWDFYGFFGKICACLAIVSGMDDHAFEAALKREIDRGLHSRTAVFASPFVVFDHFFDEADYNEQHGLGCAVSVTPYVVQTLEEVADVSPIHPQFNEAEALEQIENRYRNILRLWGTTVKRVLSDHAVRRIAVKLRTEGWKDWHLLQAIANVRVTEIINDGVHRTRKEEQFVATHGETKLDHAAEISRYNEANLRFALKLSQVQTIESLGFRVRQRTPNFAGLNSFLNRFRYWELDTEHGDILNLPNEAG
jgi:hypothetical protein